jgi:hypothetical protein
MTTGTVRTTDARTRTRLFAILAVIVVVLAGAIVGGRYAMHLGNVRAIGAGLCTAQPGRLVRLTLPGIASPYGAVSECRVLDRDADVWGDRDGSVSALLTTASGLAAVRIDLSDLQAGRQFKAVGFVLAAAGAPGVSGDVERRLGRDIAARGGVQTRAWVLHYGDG